jgi:hypothetical protein
MEAKQYLKKENVISQETLMVITVGSGRELSQLRACHPKKLELAPMIVTLKGLGIEMEQININPEWVTRGKKIKELIKELQSFENQELEVRISLDDGETHKPISIVEKVDGFCILVNSESANNQIL